MVEIAPDSVNPWTPRGAWAGIAAAGAFGAPGEPGIVIGLRGNFGLATLIAPAGGTEALSAAVERRLRLALPTVPSAVSSASHDLIWSGPGQWLLRAATRGGFSALLDNLSPHAAVSDQSDSRAALRLAGLRLPDLLGKGVMVDLHPAAFPPGRAAMTSIAHMGVQLWRSDDGDAFEVMVARSMAGSFWSWLAASAAEFGCEVVGDDSP